MSFAGLQGDTEYSKIIQNERYASFNVQLLHAKWKPLSFDPVDRARSTVTFESFKYWTHWYCIGFRVSFSVLSNV